MDHNPSTGPNSAGQFNFHESGQQKVFSKQHVEELHKNLLVKRSNNNMDIRQSMRVYPRMDIMFKKKHSYNFDMMKTEVFQNREK